MKAITKLTLYLLLAILIGCPAVKAFSTDANVRKDKPVKINEDMRLLQLTPGYFLYSVVPGHWHDDYVGGMAWLNREGKELLDHTKKL